MGRRRRRGEAIAEALEGFQARVRRPADTDRLQENTLHPACDPPIAGAHVEPLAVGPFRQVTRRFADWDQMLGGYVNHGLHYSVWIRRTFADFARVFFAWLDLSAGRSHGGEA